MHVRTYTVYCVRSVYGMCVRFFMCNKLHVYCVYNTYFCIMHTYIHTYIYVLYVRTYVCCTYVRNTVYIYNANN